jgi:alpha-D-xyloside xylohydrolase
MIEKPLRNVHPGIWTASFGSPEKHVPSQQPFVKAPKKEALARLPVAQAPFDLDQIRFSSSARGCRLELPMAAGEDIYGLGLQLKSLCHTGRKRTLRVNSDPRADTGDSHAPVPLYFSTAGYGVMIDTARYATFYCGGNRRVGAAATCGNAEADGIALDEEDLYSARRSGDSTMIVDIPTAKGVEVYFFGGPALLEAVRRYVLFCGGGCLPPEWGLGVWYRTCGTHAQEEVAELANELRTEQIPCDVLGLEPGWQSHAYSCSFSWSPERFPNHDRLLRELQEQGFRVNLWEHAFVHPSSPLYPELTEHAGDFEVWEGLVPDLSTPAARNCFADYHWNQFTAKGVSSFKLDECDNSDFIASPWSFPECAEFPSGMDGEQMHSLFGMLYQDTIECACRNGDTRTYGSVRSSHLFAPPQPFVLYSDLYDHKDFIRGVVNCGFSGLLWTPELRHAVSEEDYVRRLQAMVLSPQMLLNIWSMPHPPWRQLNRELNRAEQFLPEPEQERLKNHTRAALRLRMGFIPYLYNAFAEYRFDGIPPFRALAMDYPDEQALRQIDNAWLVGAQLLVVPFTAGETERTLPLPPGLWYDFYTGEAFQGEVVLKPALATLPILVKENAIIPVAESAPCVSDGMTYNLTLRCYGPNPQPAKLFADDGHSFGFEAGVAPRGQVGVDGILPTALQTRYRICSIQELS